MVRRKQPSEKLAGIERARADARRKRIESGLPPEADDGPPVGKLKPRKKIKAK